LASSNRFGLSSTLSMVRTARLGQAEAMQLPAPVRAFVGLLAVTAEEAKHLPDRAIELPMLAVSTALQLSLRAQQRYAWLATRGDEVLNRHSPGDEPPAWATFDEPVSNGEGRATRPAAPDPGPDPALHAGRLLDDLLGGGEDAGGTDPTPLKNAPDTRTEPARHANGSRTAANSHSAASTAPANQSTAAEPSRGGTTASRDTTGSRGTTASRRTTASRGSTDGPDKAINAPRHTAPSRFDTVPDE